MNIMKLNPKYFEFMKYGTKKVEVRLNDEKRKNIKIGEIIEFKKEPNFEENIFTKIINLKYYSNFEKLVENYKIEELANKSVDKLEFINDLNKFYTVEQQKQYGVVAIEVELIGKEDVK